jgi:protein ATS1
MLYAFGSNGSGQLGLGHLDDVSTPSEVPLPSSIQSEVPLQICAGGNHTLVLFSNNQVYASGSDENGRCGLMYSPGSHTTFRQVQFEVGSTALITTFRLCACTWEASIFVDTDDRIYTCGSGGKGELGQGINITSSVTPQQIADFPPTGTRIVDLAASMSHAVAVLSDGTAYAWGAGRKGQLGQPAGNGWTPRKILNLSFHASRVVCGKDFTLILGSPHEGSVLALGSDRWQLVSQAPKNVAGWSNVSAAWNSVYVVVGTGKLLGWGRNDHHQIPTEDDLDIDHISAGSEHALVVTQNSTLCKAYGWGEHGNCGDLHGAQDTTAFGNPVETAAGISCVGAGCATSWIIVDSSKGLNQLAGA